MSNRLTISIIIPAYNEEDYIGECLRSIAKQTLEPNEVIVVDNGSTDKTAEIARSFLFVTLISEKKSGLTLARNTGFAAASGDILCRINADVRLDPGWAKAVRDAFTDSKCAAITGPAVTQNLLYDIFPKHTTAYTRLYLRGASSYFGVAIMWGANMALRRSIWLSISRNTCADDRLVHEDQDLSLLIAAAGGRIKMVPNMLVNTEEVSYSDWPKLKEYWLRAFRTKKIHVHMGTYGSKDLQRLPMIYRVAQTPVLVIGAWLTLYCYCKYYVLRLFRRGQP